jgi:tRNA (cmo5U34)-methyltransferase
MNEGAPHRRSLVHVLCYYMDTPETWSEEASEHFLDLGRIYTPAREEIGATIVDLIPARQDEEFVAVELGVGGGWLSEAILERFPAARVLGLDGSPTMLRHTDTVLQRFTGRYELRPFRLEEQEWRRTLGAGVRCVVSSLVVHHLDGPGKRRLYADLHAQLDRGGGLLIADLVAPASEWERQYLAQAWDSTVRDQSLAHTGDLGAYQHFLDDRWNLYRHPDPVDMPSTVAEHLRWLDEAGFVGASVFWARAGHCIYGGYKSD